ncbi:hypothetical protein [Nonomuraea sp. NPDC005501]|uniref:hypothetical protein n=1 Tax=Nonomuraea sp. NPDC005501 TaxID=3156884 RepID=UPI0033AE05BC
MAGVNPLVSSAGGLYKWSVPLSSLSGTGTTHTILFHGTDGTRNDYSNLVTLTHD